MREVPAAQHPPDTSVWEQTGPFATPGTARGEELPEPHPREWRYILQSLGEMHHAGLFIVFCAAWGGGARNQPMG